MEKYTDLEQAIRDSSLVIITEDITEKKELDKVYLKYKALPNKRKRFSNYYSNEFLGHNVPEMYVFIKDKLEAEEEASEEWQPSNETFIISEPDLYYKEEDFNSGDTNICFILGHSGSGKSMMARTLEGNDIDHIELDDLLLIRDHFTMDELKDYSDMFYSFRAFRETGRPFSGMGSSFFCQDSLPG